MAVAKPQAIAHGWISITQPCTNTEKLCKYGTFKMFTAKNEMNKKEDKQYRYTIIYVSIDDKCPC